MTWLALAALAGAIAGILRTICHWVSHRQSDSSRQKWIGPIGFAICAVVLIATTLISIDALRMVAKLVMPVGLVWMGMGTMAAWCWMKRRDMLAGIATAIFLAYSLAGSNPFGSAVISTLESRVPMVDAFTLEQFDAVCVLGGGSVRRPDGMPELGEEGDRIILAATLQLNHRARFLVASGDFAADTVWIWGRLGIPASATVVIPSPRNTAEEIAAYASLIKERGWKRVGLVSSAWHLPRALRLCARQGLVLEPLPCDWQGGGSQWTALELVPQLEGFYKTHRTAWEYLGTWMGH